LGNTAERADPPVLLDSKVESQFCLEKEMEKVVEYKVLDAMSGDALGRYVLEYIAKGWQLQGGVSIGHNGSAYRFHQAIVRYGK
jgi:hypothetical protein